MPGDAQGNTKKDDSMIKHSALALSLVGVDTIVSRRAAERCLLLFRRSQTVSR